MSSPNSGYAHLTGTYVWRGEGKLCIIVPVEMVLQYSDRRKVSTLSLNSKDVAIYRAHTS